MIEFNGRRFAENEREAMDSHGTVDGIAKRHKRRIDLRNMAGDIEGAILSNGIVAAATLREDGRVWYSYGWPRIAGAELGLSDTRAAVEALATERGFCMRHSEMKYAFR
jgi:hypothetical protein